MMTKTFVVLPDIAFISLTVINFKNLTPSHLVTKQELGLTLESVNLRMIKKMKWIIVVFAVMKTF